MATLAPEPPVLEESTIAGGTSARDDRLELAAMPTTPRDASDTTTLGQGAVGEGEEGKEHSLEEGKESREGRQKERTKWTIFDPFNRVPASDPPTSMDDVPVTGLANASFISQLTFWWLQPLLVLGFKRELAATDFPKMDPSREAAYLADIFQSHFDRRRAEVEAWNHSLDTGTYSPSASRKFWWSIASRLGWGRKDGRRRVGIAMALSDTFRWQFWSAGLFKVVGDLAQVTSPLVTKQLIYYVTDSRNAARGVPGYTMPSVGKGAGFAILLFSMQIISSLCTAQTFSRGGQCGVLARGVLIAAIYRKAMVLSGRARVEITNARLVSHISTDISRVDFCSQFAHFSWTAVVYLIEVIVILLCTIGVSSLAGVALVLVVLPIQVYSMRIMYKKRQDSMKYTDARIKTISELLIGIKIVKLFGWEVPYLAKVHDLRKQELRGIQVLLNIRGGVQSLATSVPMLASVVVFAVYAAMGNSQNPAAIWTSLSLITLLRMPLMLLPNSLSTITDAHAALVRLVPVFLAETRPESFFIDEKATHALVVKDADFIWESSAPPLNEGKTSKGGKRGGQESSASTGSNMRGGVPPPSGLSNISLEVPRGQLLCVVGPVGSGKSSLLQALIGEMRRTKGDVVFGGTLGYCAQVAWSQNATLRENIIFGQSWDEKRYWNCVRASCLLDDLDMLPNGDLTQIGEKGVTLSGGQRQRVSIARTLYYDADIILLDDPLSALDAHVGGQIFEHVIKGLLGEKTRILVTHALHVLPYADSIVVMEDGHITERGTYAELMAANSAFARLSRDFGHGDDDLTRIAGSETPADVEKKAAQAKDAPAQAAKEVKAGKALMQQEERATGGVSGSTYAAFFKAGNGIITVPLLTLTILLMAGGFIGSNLTLVWWQESRWGYGEGFYSGIYAALAVFTTLTTFSMGYVAIFMGSMASIHVHRDSINSVLRAPMSFFDTTPVGRMLNRFAKDTEGMDGRLIDSLRMCLMTFASIAGAIVIIAIVSQWFLIAVAAIFACYYWLSKFYRASARSVKRHDNVLRSALYAWFSESLAGLGTIRAFGETERFVNEIQKSIDLENRAYIITVCNQRWLAVRLDFLGAILTLVVAIVAVVRRTSISPSEIGLALSTILGIQQALSMTIRQSTEVENNMASVERLVYYANDLEQEAPALIEATKPSTKWPAQGAITFKNVVMKYRPDLPPVLRGISMEIKGGERIGVVGRTGAGKSSIMLTLFRIVEVSAGSIEIDGIDIGTLGLTQLRERLSVIPQEAVLFSGTLRSNLDPFNTYDDPTLWDALRRAWLVDRTSGTISRFTLDTPIEDEGANMSVGERSLVSLARALVKNSKIVVLDEATASVDSETDSRIQQTIRTEFEDKTLLVIAHRISSIISYDRVLVLDKGQIDSFDTPEVLFKKKGIFHGLCQQSGIGIEDIRASRLAKSS